MMMMMMIIIMMIITTMMITITTIITKKSPSPTNHHHPSPSGKTTRRRLLASQEGDAEAAAEPDIGEMVEGGESPGRESRGGVTRERGKKPTRLLGTIQGINISPLIWHI